MNWRELLASASTVQTLTRATSCLRRNTVYHLGGVDNDPASGFPHQCDCSGFVDWSMGLWRQLPPRGDKWLYTDSIWEGGGEAGHGLFSRVGPGQAQPGDLYVYPSPSPHHVGHISIVVEVDAGEPAQIIHCSSSNYQNFNDAVRVTAPTVFTHNPHSRVMRPDYEALRAVVGSHARGLGGAVSRELAFVPRSWEPFSLPTAATEFPPADTLLLKSELLRGNAALEAIASGHRVLQAAGSKVEGVGPIQDALEQLGFDIDLGTGSKFRGFFGEKTQAAVSHFQESKPEILNPTGVVDSKTILALDAALCQEDTETGPVVDDNVAVVTPGKVFATLKEKPGGRPTRSVNICQLAKRPGFYYRAAMAIDVDGSPRAYTAGAAFPKALDAIGNVDAGGTGTMYIQKRFKVVDGKGHVGEGPYDNFYVSRTSLFYRGDEKYKTSNYVDAGEIPFIVFPFSPDNPDRFPGVRLGDLAYVVDLKTGAGTHAIFADTNPKVGEASLKVALNLHRSDLNANNGEEEDRFLYLLFPGTKFEPEATVPHWPDEKIKSEAEQAFAAWGGMKQVRALFPTA